MDTILFSKRGRKQVLGPLKAYPDMAMPEEGLNLLTFQLQLDTLSQCRNHRIADRDYQSLNMYFTYTSGAVAAIFLISVFTSFIHWLSTWLETDFKPKNEARKLQKRRCEAKNLFNDMTEIAAEDLEARGQLDRPRGAAPGKYLSYNK